MMKNTNRIISLLLAALMLLGSLTTVFSLGIFSVFAEETEAADGGETEETTRGEVDYMKDVFLTPQEKLSTMELKVSKDGYELYIDDYSGEVAIKNTKTDEILFTNPYDIAISTGNEATKKEILSQIIVTFTDNTGIERVFTSYEEAAERGQIVVEAIKNGVRVEYTIGRESSKVLVPRLISYERFESMILAPLYETFGDELYDPRPTNPELFDVQKVLSYFMIYSKEKLKLSKSERRKMDNIYGGLYDDLESSDAQYARALKKFPIIDTLAVFAFDPDASETELTKAESIITKYCPEYTYEEMEYDHILTEYKSDDKNPPVFRMALEYTIEEDGLSVRLPANGIRFNESMYTLSNLQVLPYMGAGNGAYAGYNFFPDGSGTLFDFEELNVNKTYSISSKVYGTDFAYHEITGTYQKTIRYPVFGIVENSTYYSYKEYDADGNFVKERVVSGAIVDALRAWQNDEMPKACVGKEQLLKEAWAELFNIGFSDDFTVNDYVPDLNPSNFVVTEVEDKRGFVAIIEEGDALASLSTYHAGALSDYNTVKMQFTPRPQDSYNLSDSISVGTDTKWTVVSDRKYVGNYKIKYVMLSDKEDVEQDTKVYDTSWFGMAIAYRDYLTNKGVIEKNNDVYENLPLYIETFGTMETTEKILSIPVKVMAPLTTFENVETIYEALAKKGMDNINFKLTGYANGGMQSTIPGKLKFEKAVGGNEGFQALLDAANEVNSKGTGHFGVFPDFDFAYRTNSKMFDGYNALRHNAKTIDNRYASKKVYSATQQKYVNYYEMVVSPAYFAEFYEKLANNYFGKYENVNGISMSTLGGALNSDFDEDEPYNREDAKKYTTDAFEYFKTNYKNAEVMTNDGNAYVWKYVDHIVGVSLDSSRYNFSSKSVPFIGIVLHGSISFAGEPLNMEGDLNYAILKAIENGASPYFILSYQNTEVLKENEQFSKYYSIRYDIWENDIENIYDKLNTAVGDVQNKYITNHEFLSGLRIPDSDELSNDVLAEYIASLDYHRNILELAEKELKEAVKIARENGRNAEAYAAEAIIQAIKQYGFQIGNAESSIGFDNFNADEYYNNLVEAYENYFAATSSTDKEKYRIIKDIIVDFNKSYDECLEAYEKLAAAYELDESADGYKALYNDLSKLYNDYGNGKSNKAQFEVSRAMLCAEFALDSAIEGYKAGKVSLAQVKKAVKIYSISKIDMGDLDDLVSGYVDGNISKSAKTALTAAKNAYDKAKKSGKGVDEAKAAFDKAVDNYVNLDNAFETLVYAWIDEEGTVTDSQLTQDLNNYANGKIKMSALNKTLATYALQNIDKDELATYIKALIKAKTDLSVAEATWDGEKGKLKTASISTTNFNKAKATYQKAISAFETAVEKYQNGDINASAYNNAVKTFDSARKTYDTALAKSRLNKNLKADAAKKKFDNAYIALANAQADISEFFINSTMSEEEITAAYASYSNALDEYYTYKAIENTYNIVIDSGFNITYEDCLGRYLALENASLMSKWGTMVTAAVPKATDYTKYTSYLMTMNESVSKNIICVDGNNAMDQEKFVAYHEASNAVNALEEEVESFQISVGRYELYVDASAKLAAMVNLGYDKKAEDSKEYTDYTRAVSDKAAKRNNAIKTIALTDSGTLSNISGIYETAVEYFNLAVAAVDILEISELKPLGMSIEYEAGREGDITAIINYDEIADASFIVKQAIDRALAVNNYVVMDKYSEIVYGQKALDDQGNQRYHNGKKLYTFVDSEGTRIYYTGTLETGYSYYTQNADGTLEIHYMGTYTGKSNADGAIYKYSLDGQVYYYIVIDGEYTYYTNYGTSNALVCIKRGDIVYELSDEAVAYVDEDGNDVGAEMGGIPVYTAKGIDGSLIYVSVDADGLYTRYTYNRSISGCYEAAAELKDSVKSVAQRSTFDETFYADLEEKIYIFNQMQANKGNKDDDVEEEEESKYDVENIVAVTYGNDDGSAYKTILLNYNNYTVRVKYEYNGVTYEYNIPAYEYVIIVY